MNITYTSHKPGRPRRRGITAILLGFAKQDLPCMEIVCKDNTEMDRLYSSILTAKWKLHKAGELESPMHLEKDTEALTLRVYK